MCAGSPRGPEVPARKAQQDARTVGRRALVVTVGTAPATPRSATASGVKSFRNQSFRILLLPLLHPDAGPRAARAPRPYAGQVPLDVREPLYCARRRLEPNTHVTEERITAGSKPLGDPIQHPPFCK